MNFDPWNILFSLLVFIPAITLHEFCHAKFADMAGDMTPRAQGRVTLNPMAHLDPIGTIMIVLSNIAGAGIGWGKPVMVNPSRMKNPRWDHFISVVMGPVSNLGIALVAAMALKFMSPTGLSMQFVEGGLQIGSVATAFDVIYLYLLYSVFMNLGLFFFNLIPLGPLDGHWLVGAFLPPAARIKWYAFCHGPGMFIFLGLVLIGSNHEWNPINVYMKYTLLPTAQLLLGR